MKWQDKISKQEIKHLRKMGIVTLAAAKRNAEHQKSLRDKSRKEGCFNEPCWECRHINEKLGLPV